MRTGPLLLALCILLLVVPLARAVSIDQPRWSVGDEWSYDIKLVENGQTIQTGDRHVVITQRGTFGGRDALWFTTYQNMSGDPSSSFADIRDATSGALLGTQSGGSTLTATQPCHDTQYPLAYPKSWTVSCDLGFGAAETFYTVAGGERLTLPAGTFETLSVDAVGNDAVRYWFAQAACGKVAEFSQTNDLKTYVNLTRVKCTPPASATPTATPAGATPTATPGPRPGTATVTPTQPNVECPPGTSHDNGSCLTSDADHDGSPLGLEIDRGTDPNDPDSDDDGIRDGDDKAPLTAGGADDNRSANGTSPEDQGVPGVGVVALVLLLAVLGRIRKPS